MKILHRYNSEERQHYLFDKTGNYPIKPKFLYSGVVKPNPEWRETPHSHNFAELLFVKDGAGTIYLNGKSYQVKKGDIAIYNAGAEHYEISLPNKPLHLYFAGIDNFELSELPANYVIPDDFPPIYPTGKMYQTFHDCFEQLILESAAKKLYYTELVNCALRQLVAHTYRLIGSSVKPRHDLLSFGNIVPNAIDYIDRNLFDSLTMDQIALSCNVSKYYLAHSFRKEKNMTVFDYIISKRLEHARTLLKSTALTVSQIAQQSGFNNLNYFCRRFRLEYGITPTQARTLVAGV